MSVFCTLLLLLSSFLQLTISSSDVTTRVKRTEIDLQTCIDNFDIHRDKIIRTQDSQNMGAKYLNEIDLGTREECLRLCCETDNCDVFVFEEKNSGSCYLFHCGPPEDFKCKFTHHVNYSSAVLAINRHLPDLESQIKLTKHEQDLTKLRKPDPDPEAVPRVPETSPPPPTTTTVKTKEVLPADVRTKPPEQGRKCSPYQFECRSTSECIAIYNACDGIPQCADGSDEAPELSCPDTLRTASPVPAHLNNLAPSPRYDPNVPPPRLHLLPQPEIYRPQLPSEALAPPQVPQAPRQDPDFIRPVPISRNNPRLPFDNQPNLPQYAPAILPMPPPNPWVPHQSNQMPAQVSQYTDKNSHIFNHKESGLQVPNEQEIRYNKPKGAMQYLHRALGYSGAGQMQYGNYQKLQSYYDSYRQPLQENWPVNPAEEPFNRYPQDPQEVRKDQVANYKTTSPDHTFNWKSDVKAEIPKHEQDKMAHELKHSKEKMEHVSSEQETKIKIEKHKHLHHEQYPDVVAYKIDESADLQDGIAETPGGAVLSLTLGLIITCIMALLIGCRLRVKRRLKKAGKSYAHDADYLVNGMYL